MRDLCLRWPRSFCYYCVYLNFFFWLYLCRLRSTQFTTNSTPPLPPKFSLPHFCKWCPHFLFTFVNGARIFSNGAHITYLNGVFCFVMPLFSYFVIVDFLKNGFHKNCDRIYPCYKIALYNNYWGKTANTDCPPDYVYEMASWP